MNKVLDVIWRNFYTTKNMVVFMQNWFILRKTKNCLKFLNVDRHNIRRISHKVQGKQEVKRKRMKKKAQTILYGVQDYNLMSCYASWWHWELVERRENWRIKGSFLCSMMVNELYLVAEEVAETKVQHFISLSLSLTFLDSQ